MVAFVLIIALAFTSFQSQPAVGIEEESHQDVYTEYQEQAELNLQWQKALLAHHAEEGAVNGHPEDWRANYQKIKLDIGKYMGWWNSLLPLIINNQEP
jgi:hypothetical protein